MDGDPLMSKELGCINQIPTIKFNNFDTEAEEDEQTGIMHLFKSIVRIRNKKAHDNVILNDSTRVIEYLGLGSLLIRLLENRIR